MKSKIVLIILMMSHLGLFAQIIKTQEEIKFSLSEVHKKNIDIINNDLSKIYGSLNDLLSRISNGSADNALISNMLNGISGQVNGIKLEVDNYKNNLNDTSKYQIDLIKNQVNALIVELNNRNTAIDNLQKDKYENIAKVILGYIKNVEDLSKKLNDLDNEKNKLQNELNVVKERNKILSDTIKYLNSELKLSQTELKYLTAGPFKVALSAGLNYEFIGDAKYIINKDSSAREITTKGLQGMVSAVVLYHPDSLFNRKNNIDFLLNVPIAEIGFGDNTNITSIFNRPLALGLGIGYSLTSNFSVCGIFNVSRAQIIDDQTLKEKKFTEEYLSIVDLSKYSTSVRTKMSFTIGFLYKFGKGQK